MAERSSSNNQIKLKQSSQAAHNVPQFRNSQIQNLKSQGYSSHQQSQMTSQRTISPIHPSQQQLSMEEIEMLQEPDFYRKKGDKVD